ncbi:MAG: prepilin-type N-terminal cleavage/methylation domain-containing protein [Kiritimatiellae bacterium]|nr:prepilin-type N-terminal cleavage/methylation domain-containing protein [Kiritimatiellia bacterium]
MNFSNAEARRRSGFTLIEILIATTILAGGLIALMGGLGNCAQMMMLSKQYQDAQFVFSLGERRYPIPEQENITEPEEDERLNIDPVTADDMIDDLELDISDKIRNLYRGYTFERHVDEKELDTDEEDDGLYLLRTRITWGKGSDEEQEELVRLIRIRK